MTKHFFQMIQKNIYKGWKTYFLFQNKALQNVLHHWWVLDEDSTIVCCTLFCLILLCFRLLCIPHCAHEKQVPTCTSSALCLWDQESCAVTGGLWMLTTSELQKWWEKHLILLWMLCSWKELHMVMQTHMHNKSGFL